jgi:hypothetical protein
MCLRALQRDGHFLETVKMIREHLSTRVDKPKLVSLGRGTEAAVMRGMTM